MDVVAFAGSAPLHAAHRAALEARLVGCLIAAHATVVHRHASAGHRPFVHLGHLLASLVPEKQGSQHRDRDPESEEKEQQSTKRTEDAARAKQAEHDRVDGENSE